MSSESLEVMPREATGTKECRRMRRQGLVPAVLYGHGEECINLVAKREAIEAVVRHGSMFIEDPSGNVLEFKYYLHRDELFKSDVSPAKSKNTKIEGDYGLSDY